MESRNDHNHNIYRCIRCRCKINHKYSKSILYLLCNTRLSILLLFSSLFFSWISQSNMMMALTSKEDKCIKVYLFPTPDAWRFLHLISPFPFSCPGRPMFSHFCVDLHIYLVRYVHLHTEYNGSIGCDINMSGAPWCAREREREGERGRPLGRGREGGGMSDIEIKEESRATSHENGDPSAGRVRRRCGSDTAESNWRE